MSYRRKMIKLPVQTAVKIDWGKPVMVIIFGLFVCIHAAQVTRYTANLRQLSSLGAFGLVHHSLILCFYALLVAAYWTRPPAKIASRSPVARLAAVVATILPFALPFVSTASDQMSVVVLGNCLAIAGLGFTVYALQALGRNISIIPQARSLVQSGPYRLLRHPLYAGELMTTFGIVVARPGIGAAAVLLGLAVLQVYRARQEEEVLETTFPEYRTYALRTPRFIPGCAPVKRRLQIADDQLVANALELRSIERG